jgi:hypothetical protein
VPALGLPAIMGNMISGKKSEIFAGCRSSGTLAAADLSRDKNFTKDFGASKKEPRLVPGY